MSLHIYVLNGSTRVTDDEAATMTAAVEWQLREHFAPSWSIRGASVSFLRGKPLKLPAYVLTLVDAIADQPAGVLGYHDEDAKGTQFGVVAASPSLDNGGQVLTGDWSVASILSHEILEWAGDPACNRWAHDGGARLYCQEACDPVEAPTYTVQGVSVSNFITPAWLDPQAPAGSRFDHLGLLTGPFSLLPGGYCVYAAGGAEHQQFGDEFPGWRKAMKAGPRSRTHRRMVQGAQLDV